MVTLNHNTARQSHTPRNHFTGSLPSENRYYAGTGGISQETRHRGFVPAFLDRRTGQVFRSCFANGKPSPVHMLDGLPSYLVTQGASGELHADSARLVSGFLRGCRFYNRDEAAAYLRGNVIQ